MRIPQLTIGTLALMLLATPLAQAHLTVESSGGPAGPLVPGEEYTVDVTGYINCAVVGPQSATVPEEVPEAGGTSFPEYVEGQVLIFSIANGDEFSWLNASEHETTISQADCAPGTAGETPGVYIAAAHTVTYKVASTAPAFTEFTFQPGAYDEANDGGSFTAEIAYNPAFTAPTGLSFNAISDGATATIPFTMAANADSTFSFEVTEFTVDGEHAPDGSTAHIQETLDVATGIFSETGTTATSIDLHFGLSEEEHDDHDSMEMEEGGHDDMEMSHDDEDDSAHAHWETAQVTVAITLAAQEDATLVSEAQEVLLTFTNTDTDSMPHDDEHDDEGSNFLPGFELLVAVAALGAIAVLRRRSA